MKKLLFTFFIGLLAQHLMSQCPNANFEQGNTSSWIVDYKNVSAFGMLPFTWTTGLWGKMYSGTGTDPRTLNAINSVSTGGNYSLMLNDSNYLNNGISAARARYTINVNPQNSIFTFKYASVLKVSELSLHPNFSVTDRPYFQLKVYDASGTQINNSCAQVLDIAQKPMPGYTQCVINNSSPQAPYYYSTDTVAYKNWTSVGIDLSSYNGQNITFEFVASTCQGSGNHWAYAYIDAQCAPKYDTIYTCPGSVTLNAPTNYTSYSWSTGSTATSVTINNPVNDQTVTCTLTSTPGCEVVKYYILKVNPVNVTGTGASICAGNTATISAGGGSTYNWMPGNLSGSSVNVNPTSNTTYTVTGTTSAGCTDTAHVTVTVGPPPSLIITNPAAVCAPQTVDITAASVTAGSTGGGTLSYWTNASATTPLSNPGSISTSGTYYIKSSTGVSCQDIEGVTVVINPSPVLSITDPPPVCAPLTVDITASLVTAGSTGGGTLTYWQDQNASAVLNNPSSITVSGTYYIQALTSNGCSDLKPVNVVIEETPVLVVTNPAPVCEPLTVDITAPDVIAGTTGIGIVSYWTDPSATNSLNNPSLISNSATYYIKITTSAGCYDIEPVSVIINDSPVLQINSPSPVCEPSVVDITSPAVTAGSFGVGALSYWEDQTASIQVNNPGTISVSGTYYIQSINAGGCSDIEPVVVVIDQKPVLNITDPAPVCSPATVDITVATVTSGSTGTGTYTYWLDSTAIDPSSNPSAINLSGVFYIKLETVAGCFDIASVNVTINPMPVLVINSLQAVCSPATIDITVPALTAGSSSNINLAYWYDLQTTSSIANPSAIDISGTYFISATNQFGCRDIDSVICSINQLPVLLINNPAQVCEPEVIDITDTAITNGSSGLGILSYFTDSTLASTLASPQIISQSGTYYIIASNAAGCSDTNKVTCLINPAPDLVVINPPPVCEGIKVDVNDSTVIQLNANVDQVSFWIDNQCTVPMLDPDGVIQSGTYFIHSENSYGCKRLDSVDVVINPLPTLIITNPISVCEPSKVDITASYITAGSTLDLSYTYWSDVNMDTLLVSPQFVSVSGTYYIEASTQEGCKAFDSVKVIVNPLPAVDFAGDKLSGCAPLCVNFSDSSKIVSGNIVSWEWSFENANSIEQNTPNCFNDPGAYDVSLTVSSDSGCVRVLTRSDYINVYPNPVANFIASPNSVSLFEPEVHFVDYSSSDVVAWYWNFGDGNYLSVDVENPTHIYLNQEPGTYNVILDVVNQYGCIDRVMNPIVIEPEFTFYIPNAFSPNNDGVNNEFFGTGIGIVKYEMWIYDRWGESIFYTNDMEKGWDGKANGGERIAQEDVYVWKVKLKDIFDRNHDYYGTVTLLK